jgi:rod shape-determining protein MreD
MSLSVAAVAGVLAALLEISVVPGLTSFAQPNVVFIIAVVATMMIGVEEGLAIAFFGGLMTDLLLAGHQLGGTSLVLLSMTAVAAVVSRLLPPRRVSPAVVVVLLLALVVQPLQVLILAATAGTPATIDPLNLLPSAVVDALLAAPLAAALRLGWLRYGAHERMEW